MGSGSVGSSSFNAVPFTITAVANTAGIARPIPGVYFVVDASASIAIAGLGTFAFRVPTQVVDNQTTSIAGFSTAPGIGGPQGLAILGDNDAAFSTYALATTIGPIPGTPRFNAGFPSSLTSGGVLILNAATAVSFQASATAVPEPPSLGLCGIAGVVGLGYARLRRKSAARPRRSPWSSVLPAGLVVGARIADRRGGGMEGSGSTVPRAVRR